MNDEPRSGDEHPAPDLEVRAGWSAKRVRRTRDATVRTATAGDVERWDELTENQPAAPAGKRWRLRAWLRDPTRLGR